MLKPQILPKTLTGSILSGPDRLRVDLGTRRAYADQREIALTKQSFDLLAYLVEHQGRVVPNSELIKAIWAHEVVEDRRFLQTAMYRLRSALRQAEVSDPIEVVRGVGYSIGRRTLAERDGRDALREQGALEAAIRNAQVPTMLVDRGGRVVLANDAIAKQLGYTPRELEELSSLAVVVSPESREAHVKAYALVLSGGVATAPNSIMKRRDGSLISVDFFVRPIVLDGEVIGSVIEGLESAGSSRATADVQLDASVEVALRASALPTIIIDAEQRVLLANAAMARLTGYTVEELEALPTAEVLSPPDWREARRHDLAKIVDGQSRDGAIEPVLRRDGTVIEADLFAEPLSVDGEVVGVMVQLWVARGDPDVIVSGPESPLTEELGRSVGPAG